MVRGAEAQVRKDMERRVSGYLAKQGHKFGNQEVGLPCLAALRLPQNCDVRV